MLAHFVVKKSIEDITRTSAEDEETTVVPVANDVEKIHKWHIANHDLFYTNWRTKYLKKVRVIFNDV